MGSLFHTDLMSFTSFVSDSQCRCGSEDLRLGRLYLAFFEHNEGYLIESSRLLVQVFLNLYS